jgi:SAM-dependent methyltransferase
MLRRLRDYVEAQQYNPGWAGLFLNPFYHARRGLYAAMARAGGDVHGNVLDVGCGRKPYRHLFHCRDYLGLEIDTPENRATKAADYFYDGKTFPFADARFDTVVCNQVLEHVFEPQDFLGEIRRVTRPGGDLLITVPFAWDEHEQPRDFARYSSFGLRSLLEKAGFEIVRQEKINADVRVLFQLANAYLHKVLWTRSRALNLLVCILFMAPANILGAVFARVLPSNPDLYLDQLVLARRKAA